MTSARRKPTPAELALAPGRTVPDLVGPGLAVLFVGINPSLYSAALGLHFARPGNRFWPALIGAGFVPPGTGAFEQSRLLERGFGITNICDRATRAAGELPAAELAAGARALVSRVRRLAPRVLAFLGLSAYRIAFGRPDARPGRQSEVIGGTEVWVLPNPSGLNANYQLPELIRLYGELRERSGGAPCPCSSNVRPASNPRATSPRSSRSSSAASTRGRRA